MRIEFFCRTLWISAGKTGEEITGSRRRHIEIIPSVGNTGLGKMWISERMAFISIISRLFACIFF